MGKYPDSKKCVFRNEETEGDRDLTLNIDLNHLRMNYQEKLALDFKNEDYQSVIDVLKQNIEKGIARWLRP